MLSARITPEPVRQTVATSASDPAARNMKPNTQVAMLNTPSERHTSAPGELAT